MQEGSQGCVLLNVKGMCSGNPNTAVKIMKMKTGIREARIGNILKLLDPNMESTVYATSICKPEPSLLKKFKGCKKDRTKEDHVVIEMPYAGDTLLTYILNNKSKLYDDLMTLSMFRSVAIINSLGVIHRDIKDNNLVISNPNTKTLKVRLIDFGWSGSSEILYCNNSEGIQHLRLYTFEFNKREKSYLYPPEAWLASAIYSGMSKKNAIHSSVKGFTNSYAWDVLKKMYSPEDVKIALEKRYSMLSSIVKGEPSYLSVSLEMLLDSFMASLTIMTHVVDGNIKLNKEITELLITRGLNPDFKKRYNAVEIFNKIRKHFI